MATAAVLWAGVCHPTINNLSSQEEKKKICGDRAGRDLGLEIELYLTRLIIKLDSHWS